MAAEARSKRSRPVSATAWKKNNDRGPHKAVLPSLLDTGAYVEFVVPDNGLLLRSGRLPDRLKKFAKLAAAHSGGTEGYLDDIVTRAIVQDRLDEAQEQMLDDGLELAHWLIAEMVIDPQITAEEVANGDLPSADVLMLLQFADRRRNVDAAGNQLPFIVLGEWATFRSQPESASSTGTGETAADDDQPAIPDPDGDLV